MKNRAVFYLVSIVCLSLALISVAACAETDLTPTTAPQESSSAETETLPAETEQTTVELPFKTPEGLKMICEKGLEKGREDMTHFFSHKYYESFTDEASGLRYHRLYRICRDCGVGVDFGTTRCKTNSHFCEAGCL